jgi:hypothetical protein
MPYYPPNVSAQTLPVGINQVYLTGLKPIDDPAKLAKFSAQVVYIATYKSVETAVEIDSVIKFSGTRADFFAGQTIDRLHQVAGLPEPVPGEPLDLTALIMGLEGVPFEIEINDKGYVQNVLAPAVIGSDEAF